MCPEGSEEPTISTGRAGLFGVQKRTTVEDDKVDGDYGLVINGHSLVRRRSHRRLPQKEDRKSVV